MRAEGLAVECLVAGRSFTRDVDAAAWLWFFEGPGFLGALFRGVQQWHSPPVLHEQLPIRHRSALNYTLDAMLKKVN